MAKDKPIEEFYTNKKGKRVKGVAPVKKRKVSESQRLYKAAVRIMHGSVEADRLTSGWRSTGGAKTVGARKGRHHRRDKKH